jgi:hypothetical protein
MFGLPFLSVDGAKFHTLAIKGIPREVFQLVMGCFRKGQTCFGNYSQSVGTAVAG